MPKMTGKLGRNLLVDRYTVAYLLISFVLFLCICIYPIQRHVVIFASFGFIVMGNLGKNSMELGIPLSVMFGNQYMISLLLHILLQFI